MVYDVSNEAKMVSHNGVAMSEVSEYGDDRSRVVAVGSGRDWCKEGAAAVAAAKC